MRMENRVGEYFRGWESVRSNSVAFGDILGEDLTAILL